MIPQFNASVLVSGELLVNLSQHRIFYRDMEIDVSKREFEIIEFLITNAGQVFDRERIYEAVWGLDGEGSSDTIMEHVRKIRAKLASCTLHNYIDTVWGCGYRWNV